ncbi:MAG: PAS domain-containing protein [Peptococcaceae bacterium]|nr:PAS domain-containing protein [Peptococcaceae bacterium]
MDDIAGLFLKLFNFIETPIFMVSYPDLCFIASNSASNREFVSLLLDREVCEDEIIGKTIDDVFLDSNLTVKFRETLYQAGSEKRAVRLENLLFTDQQGGINSFNVVCFPLTNGNDSVRYIVGSAVDVSHRLKVAEQEKYLSEAREALKNKDFLLSVLNILPVGVLYYNRNKALRFVNDSFYWISGYEREDILGLQRDEAEKMLFRYIDSNEGDNGKNSPENNVFIITKYNEVKPVELYHIPLVKAGLVDGVASVIREKKSEQGFYRSNITLQAVLDGILSAVVITDNDSYVVACNREFLELCELEEGQVIGQPVNKLQNLLNLQSTDISYQEFKNKKDAYKFQATITTRSGKKKTLSINNRPLLNRRGELTGLVSVATDITTFIEKQENLIENERLAVIGQLTSGIAHEIKNPLTVISGFAEVTKSKIMKITGNDSLKESMLYYQQEIVDNCRQMNRLIIDLLQLARPRKTERVRINLASTLDKICNSLAPYALQKNVTLIKNLTAADIDMEIDPVQIGQVLLNLCNNAIQAMTDGGILNISTELSNGFLIIQVSDTGSGIKPEDLGKLGTPFFTTKAEGTGLGLSVTYSIVRDYGGKIEVESEVGKGSVFKVYLPLSKAVMGNHA